MFFFYYSSSTRVRKPPFPHLLFLLCVLKSLPGVCLNGGSGRNGVYWGGGVENPPFCPPEMKYEIAAFLPTTYLLEKYSKPPQNTKDEGSHFALATHTHVPYPIELTMEITALLLSKYHLCRYIHVCVCVCVRLCRGPTGSLYTHSRTAMESLVVLGAKKKSQPTNFAPEVPPAGLAKATKLSTN